MYETLKMVIADGGYVLADLLERIDVLYAAGRLTEDQRRMLVQTAEENADPDDSLPDADTRLGALELRVAELESRVSALEATPPAADTDPDGGSDAGDGTGAGVDDGWPEYRRPASKDEYYTKGDRITFEGAHWECVKNNVVDDPSTYPKAWRKVEDATDWVGA